MTRYVSNVTVRVAAMLVAGTSATVTPSPEGGVVITCMDRDAVLVVAAFRKARHWLDRFAPPRPPRGGSRRLSIVTPIVARVTPLGAGDVVIPFGDAFTPEMDALVRRSQRR